MIKQKIFIIFILLSLGVLLITTLYFVSENLNHPSHHFNRQLISPIPVLWKTINLDNSAYYVAGATANSIYLGSEVNPLTFLVVSIKDDNTVITQTKNLGNIRIRSGRLSVDSPYFYLADRVSKITYQGLISDCSIINNLRDSFNSDLCIPISNNSLALRVFTNHGFDYTLGKEWIFPQRIMMDSGVLDKRNDGIFTNDGMLDYDHEAHKLVYVYYYRNQFITLDTNLDLLSRVNTIDTTNDWVVRTAMVKTDNTFVLAEPPQIVNHCSYSFRNTLFINSTVMADNEKRSLYRRSSVIDVYDLNKGEYKYSFYLPKYKGNKIKNLAITDNYLTAVSGPYLLIYKFHLR